MKFINIDELSKFMSDNALLIDVRLPHEFNNNHLNGAINMPYTNILSLLKSYPKDKLIILYCNKGYHSQRIGKMLISLGYTNIYILNK